MVDGLTGFPDAIATVFPQTAVQTCIVHLIRNSLAFVSWKDRKKVMPDLKAIYRAETAEAAAAKLDEFEAAWGPRYPAIAPAWRRAWEHVVPMFAFPPAIRKLIYTTDEMDKRFLRGRGRMSVARATSWRRAALRLKAPPGCLTQALPA